MKIGIVGGGMLGLTLAYRLSSRGHRVEVFESSPELGGLAAPHDFGPFTWDKFYHCILPTDSNLIGLLVDLGLEGDLRRTRTKTGYCARGQTYSMSGNADFLRFPLLSILDKARLAATMVYATRAADPWKLYTVSAQDWLVRWCGKRCYEVFWRPLLRAKFGVYYDKVAAVFIWATLTRLFGARSKTTSKEKLGYCHGGYGRILGRLESRLLEQNAVVRRSSPVLRISRCGNHCELAFRNDDSEQKASFDQVIFTAPARLARAVVSDELIPLVEQFENEYPTSGCYLGVACLVLAVSRPLTPYYVLNIGDENVHLTGLVEMTNLIDASEETSGLSLVYVPWYMDSEDPRLSADDPDLKRTMMERGVEPLFPDLRETEIVYAKIHRARYVQPLPLVRRTQLRPTQPTVGDHPFRILNTSMLAHATLNNNEVVGLVSLFLQGNLLGDV